ncbi:MAG: indolepyruvate oxidoreductase subunit beta [Candidatus Aenigmatarchaeota archaeon]
MKEFNVVIVGIGGQGVLTLAFILAEAALKQGYDVKTSELHGLAQRGGAVSSHVRFGKKIYSSLVMECEANLITGLERLETLRACYYSSKENGTAIVFDTFSVVPISVSILGEKYPSLGKTEEILKEFSQKVYPLEATEIAKKEIGNGIYSNILLLGYAFGLNLIPLKKKNIEEAIREIIPEKYLNENLKAFNLGIEKANR